MSTAIDQNFEADTENKNYQWALVKKSLNELLGDNIYYNWLNDLQLEYVANGQVLLKAPSRFVREWVINNYLHPIRNVWQQFDQSIIWVNIYYDHTTSSPVSQNPITEMNVAPAAPIMHEASVSSFINNINNPVYDQASQNLGAVYCNSDSFVGQNFNNFNNQPLNQQLNNIRLNTQSFNYPQGMQVNNSFTQINETPTDIFANNNDPRSFLDPRFTFESFVTGSSNEFAFRAARAVAGNKNSNFEFNPLFLYSPVGHGKTHLMHAIAWEITRQFPEQKLCYLSAEKFMFQFVKSLKNKDMISFKEQFRSVDVLMIDDLQFICGKESTQEEFFHTFNALIDGNRKIILACDRSPNELEGLDNRFKSRLGCGLVADINFSDYELRLQILSMKAKMLNLVIENNVLDFLATKITTNIRELEGALNKLVAYSTLMNKKINLDVVNVVLKDLLRTSSKSITVELIQQKVADYYKLTVTNILSSSRERKLARPRQLAMFLCKKHTLASLLDIGRRFGGRDHTTVMHAIKQMETLLVEDNELMNDVAAIERSILG
ncbi:MAG: chromosomal replication initiator protein DnaA [Sphingobacteriia bacterium]|nr:chromosomal replication initiator protein DnaA [Sphingobacteriia bacterium]